MSAPPAPAGPGAVLFDLDGTLVDTERASGEAVCRVFRARYGLDPGDAARSAVIGASWEELLRALHDRFGLTEPDFPGLKTALLAEKAALLGPEMPLLPGAAAALTAAAEAYPTGVVTGSWRGDVAMVLDHLGLADAIRVVVGSEDVARGKPDPEGYLRAARALGMPPAGCLAVEDSERGVEAALAAGAKVVAVRAGSMTPDDLGAADAVIETLEGVDAPALAALWLGAPP